MDRGTSTGSRSQKLPELERLKNERDKDIIKKNIKKR